MTLSARQALHLEQRDRGVDVAGSEVDLVDGLAVDVVGTPNAFTFELPVVPATAKKAKRRKPWGSKGKPSRQKQKARSELAMEHVSMPVSHWPGSGAGEVPVMEGREAGKR